MSRVVYIGSLPVGGAFPVRVQSMTNTSTSDVLATVDQIQQLADLGCEIVRVAVQGNKEALACEKIRALLLKRGYSIPLVADIHFYPPAAMQVLDFVDKVRINPGNFVKKASAIEEFFLPLIEKCKKQKKALRIGVNHGSLSPWILESFGNTKEGMVASALEYAVLCKKNEFFDVFISMKASNLHTMISAHKLLQEKMAEEVLDFPLHIGLTEAGFGLEGKVKSAIGIGSLLLEGIGDTIRVSLTGDPKEEIAIAKELSSLKKHLKFPHREREDVPLLFSENIKAVPLSSKNPLEILYEKLKRPLYLTFSDSIESIATCGALLLHGLIDGLAPKPSQKELGDYILQACRLKMSTSEFISCPTCGRTLFDLSSLAKSVREKTKHLIGLTIGVMGCNVNGPGEMAEADFGLVGSSKNTVDLYEKSSCVERGIPLEKALQKLIELIKLRGRWINNTTD